MSPDNQILDCKLSDNEYLHMDFHGALCYSIYYLDAKYGQEATRRYLRQVGRTCYAPLSERLRAEGLPALDRHWQRVFAQEGGSFSLHYEDEMLVLTIERCPAIAHLKQRDQLFTERYCETTVVVNETICQTAGFGCSCQYEPGQGRCVQKFWQESDV